MKSASAQPAASRSVDFRRARRFLNDTMRQGAEIPVGPLLDRLDL